MATWSHEVKNTVPTKRGFDVTVEFERNGTGDKRTCTFHFDTQSQISTSGPARLARKKAGYELSWSALNSFDLGDDGGESREILWLLVRAIRNNPNLTITQAVTWYNTNYPDGLYNGTQLLLRMRRWIESETGYEPTWDQFKTYVINNVFEEVD